MLSLEKYLQINNGISTKWQKEPFSLPYSMQNIQAGYYNVGKNNRVFAFMGVPKTPMPKGGYPAVVLVHGGLGYAYYEWVKKWTDNGYIAIAPDFDSQYAVGTEYDKRYREDELERRRVENIAGGPRGYGSITETNSDNPWVYFSVLSIKKALEVLLQENVINQEKVGLVGISWGGVLSLIASSVEKRFKAVEIFYSTGFISNSKFGYTQGLKDLTEEQLEIYNNYLDPQTYLSKITQPIAFFAGTNDTAFVMKNRRRTTDLIKGNKTFSYRLNFPHGHFEVWEYNMEDLAFLDSVFYGKTLPKAEIEIENGVCKLTNNNAKKTTLVYTTEEFLSEDTCTWQEIEIENGTLFPNGVTGYFVTATDKNKTRFSSNIVICKK
ncbi:MAG: dienelactone hydrolase family protein [Clostridia bacterium]|nr:dienelactone hydrolase family protein [Clostridia bacterium]